MPASLNNVTVSSTSYTPALTLIGAGKVARVNLIVKQAEIYYQLTQPDGTLNTSAWQFTDEVFMPRMSQSLDRTTSGIRLRLAASGDSALVTATLIYEWEL